MAEFVVSGAIRPADLVRLLADQGRLVVERRTRLARGWLDTADARLAAHRASLLHERDGDAWQLLLDVAGRRVRVPASALPPRWPADLPPALAGQLTGWLGLRALLPQQGSTVSAVVLRLLDDEDKTVTRVWLETAAKPKRQRVRVEALRGYERTAAKVSATLAADSRLARTPDARPVARAAPAAPDLVRNMAATAAVVAVLRYLLDTVEANVEGTIGALDTEFLHDLRVAVRRSRAVVKLGHDVLPTAFVTRFAPRLRWLGDLTTPARDLDVQLLDLPGLRAQLPPEFADDLGPLCSVLTGKVAAAYAELGKGLRSARFRQLCASYRAALSRVESTASPSQLAGAAADRWAGAIMRKVLRRGKAIDADSPPEALHDLRKRCKELRYCLEMFAPLWDRAILSRFVSELKQLQDNLGSFQDSAVQIDLLRRHAETIAADGGSGTAAAMLAIGRLTAHLEVQQHAARAEFADRFARFSSTANRRRFDRLIGAS